MKERSFMGRFSVQFVVANNRDVVQAAPGVPIPEGVMHVALSGVADSGATRLMLPQAVASRKRSVLANRGASWRRSNERVGQARTSRPFGDCSAGKE